MTLVNSEDALFDDPLALAMLIDIFSERGYQALVDVNHIEVPHRIDPHTHEIICRQKRVYRFSGSLCGLSYPARERLARPDLPRCKHGNQG